MDSTVITSIAVAVAKYPHVKEKINGWLRNRRFRKNVTKNDYVLYTIHNSSGNLDINEWYTSNDLVNDGKFLMEDKRGEMYWSKSRMKIYEYVDEELIEVYEQSLNLPNAVVPRIMQIFFNPSCFDNKGRWFVYPYQSMDQEYPYGIKNTPEKQHYEDHELIAIILVVFSLFGDVIYQCILALLSIFCA